ncbi:hypothetical protein HYPSUDRAFT_202159 [Hypholoma sublateritium FD-334 SS-4]|uniref:Uncharacterized protein n=1 Tax=Hypholoma sublateritium (strain FD-334 SS-4) TaxID=945553 RepID=A0A0D2PR51_HYPSF|nr:hypothetical protein HYPSUDRAFT_202159 [Hypholoma sublateritium FD-334 SS-4]
MSVHKLYEIQRANSSHLFCTSCPRHAATPALSPVSLRPPIHGPRSTSATCSLKAIPQQQSRRPEQRPYEQAHNARGGGMTYPTPEQRLGSRYTAPVLMLPPYLVTSSQGGESRAAHTEQHRLLTGNAREGRQLPLISVAHYTAERTHLHSHPTPTWRSWPTHTHAHSSPTAVSILDSLASPALASHRLSLFVKFPPTPLRLERNNDDEAPITNAGPAASSRGLCSRIRRIACARLLRREPRLPVSRTNCCTSTGPAWRCLWVCIAVEKLKNNASAFYAAASYDEDGVWIAGRAGFVDNVRGSPLSSGRRNFAAALANAAVSLLRPSEAPNALRSL